MSTEQAFTQNDYEIIKRDVVYQGFFRLVCNHLRFRLYDGGWSNVVMREVLERNPAAAVLPYDPVHDRVILIEQFRPGALANPDSPWLKEIIAGIIDHEDPEQLVLREAQEEAGCEILDLYPICEYFVSPGGSNEQMFVYCGRVDATQADGIYGLVAENENIRTITLSTEDAFTQLQQGKIKTSPAIIALQWLQLNRGWLKQLWQTK